MKKTLAFFYFILITSFAIQAQKPTTTAYNDRVVFKNGSVLYSIIRHYIPDDTLSFELPNGDIVSYSPTLIKKVAMANPTSVRMERPYLFREKGLYGTLSYANSFGKSAEDKRIGVGASASVGWKFNRWMGLGLGASYDQMYIKGGDAPILAAYGEWRGYLRSTPTTEFFSLVAGIGQPLKLKNDLFAERNAGFMLQPTVGYRFGASNRYNFFVDAGARFQRVGYLTLNRFAENRYTITYQRWILRGGLVF